MLLLLPLWLCRNVCLVFVEARQDPFGTKSLYSSNYLTARTGFAVPFQSTELGTEYWRMPEVLV